MIRFQAVKCGWRSPKNKVPCWFTSKYMKFFTTFKKFIVIITLHTYRTLLHHDWNTSRFNAGLEQFALKLRRRQQCCSVTSSCLCPCARSQIFDCCRAVFGSLWLLTCTNWYVLQWQQKKHNQKCSQTVKTTRRSRTRSPASDYQYTDTTVLPVRTLVSRHVMMMLCHSEWSPMQRDDFLLPNCAD